jgi:hypothetical protein
MFNNFFRKSWEIKKYTFYVQYFFFENRGK